MPADPAPAPSPPADPVAAGSDAGPTDPATPGRSAAAAYAERKLDARSLRALAHPLRLRALESIRRHGPATSAMLGKRLDESTGTLSWHLRLLAEHGFIEEDAERGTRRERWWRAVGQGHRVDMAELRGSDPETAAAADLYGRLLVDQLTQRVALHMAKNWNGTRWEGTGTVSDWGDMRMTPPQLQSLIDDLFAVIARHREGAAEPADDAEPVTVQLQAFPNVEPVPQD